MAGKPCACLIPAREPVLVITLLTRTGSRVLASAKKLTGNLRMEVGLGSGDIVLDGTQLPPPQKKGAQPPPIFWPMSIVAKRLDASVYHLVWR